MEFIGQAHEGITFTLFTKDDGIRSEDSVIITLHTGHGSSTMHFAGADALRRLTNDLNDALGAINAMEEGKTQDSRSWREKAIDAHEDECAWHADQEAGR